MASRLQRAGAILLSASLLALVATSAGAAPGEPPHPASLDEAIVKAAARHGIPESLVRRIVMRESKYDPRARNQLYWGLMQISYPTAKSMGFKGTREQLLNPVTNLRYAVPYLANAFLIAGKHQDAAVRLYAAGYYDTAKRRGLLGMLRTADSAPLSGVPDEPDVVANLAPVAPPPQDTGIFGALFGPRQMTREEQPQQVASADPASVAIQQPAPTAPAATFAARSQGLSGQPSDDITLVADKHGHLAPPKKWQHDGGSTVIARGEQPVERVAAFEKSDGATDSGRSRHHKVTVFASLDQPASAQAYAGGAPQDPRLLQTPSQAAITQATAGQPVPDATQGPQAAAAPDAATPTTLVAEDDTRAKTHKRHIARRSRHHDAPDAVAQAAAPEPAAQQPAAAAEGQPQAQQAAVEPPAQPATAPAQAMDASGYPVDASGRAPETADLAPMKKKRRVAHRAHPHNATAVAQDDSKTPPAAQ